MRAVTLLSVIRYGRRMFFLPAKPHKPCDSVIMCLYRATEYPRLYREKTDTPGIVGEGVPVPEVYLGGRTEVTEVSGTGIEVVQNFPEVSGTGIELVRNSLKCGVHVLNSYRLIPECRVGY